MITFSKIVFFFVTVFPFWMLVLTYLSISAATPNLRICLQVTEVAWDGGSPLATCEGFFRFLSTLGQKATYDGSKSFEVHSWQNQPMTS
jgi:hypothetical protein